MKWVVSFMLVLIIAACQPLPRLTGNGPSSPRLTGSAFYETVATFDWKQRDSFAVKEILAGNFPSFLSRFVPVTISAVDSSNGKKIEATFYVTADYLSIGTDDDWARVPLTPMAAQKIADMFECFLPTRKIVDAIYEAAKVKLEPVPLFAFRDSSPTFYHHHLIIEGQRKGREGLVAGIKKDVVICSKILGEEKPGKVAIYGWHKPDGKPIQPLYTRHVNWYVDYSHGIRLIHRRIKVNGQLIDYKDALRHPVYKQLLCDEPACDYFKYPY